PADAGALRQIMLNLLDNAVKYGAPGQSVAISATVNGDAARIAVEDQGPGVEPEHAVRIWEAFYRGSRAQATGGTGIGLTMGKQLAELHHGRVWVERGESAGARFLVELPQATLACEMPERTPVAASV